MPPATLRHTIETRREAVGALVTRVRGDTLRLVAPLSPEDCQVQSMDDASPAKWHLAHTTWFFDSFVLDRFAPGLRVGDRAHAYRYNSYYESLGARHPRPRRGLVSRPSLDEVLRYRRDVDAALASMIDQASASALDMIELGCHHEQQHQELILTDIRHALLQSVLAPAYLALDDDGQGDTGEAETQGWFGYAGGVREIGHSGNGFAFDNEGPRHRVFVGEFRLAARPVSNAEWRGFIADGGYRTPSLWLSDGWRCAVEQGWTAPLYWHEDGEREFTLHGMRPMVATAPVSCVSFYEADAFARWAGLRLPTEAEWEVAAEAMPVVGNLGWETLRPGPAPRIGRGPAQLFGDVWEWTASPYTAYPGFKPSPGAVGEYNGKFMANQMVLRGGSCVTPLGHVRASYRNFFPPSARWQFSGVRLAADG
jgi:ergothioneine biosynthesis protein EgtB